jgi:hypothetical protein
MNARIPCVVASAAAFLFFCASLSAAQTLTSRDYLSQLDNLRISEMPDGRTVVAMDAVAGDIRGVLSLTLSPEGAAVTGVWAFSATYLEDLRADGTPIAPADHFGHEHDDPSTPEMHREYAHMRRDGVITGTADAVTLMVNPDGRIVGISAATLTISGGSRTFANASGSGRVGPWPTMPRELTLLLSVQVAK